MTFICGRIKQHLLNIYSLGPQFPPPPPAFPAMRDCTVCAPYRKYKIPMSMEMTGFCQNAIATL